MPTPLTRRQFLRLGLGGTLGLLAGLRAAAAPAAPGDYRALVCIFLAGGNDAFNTLVPTDTEGYADYQRARTTLALKPDTLEPLTGTDYGLHRAARDLADAFAAGDLAVLANVGPLIAPVTRAEVLAGRAPLPPQLYSHNDQQRLWMNGDPRGTLRTGWAGRIADYLDAAGLAPPPGVNWSFGPANLLQSGARTQPYALTESGAVTLEHLDDPRGAPLRAVYEQLADLAAQDGNLLARTYAARQRRALDNAQRVAQALAGAPALDTFPDNPFGQRLRTVARLIAARDALGTQRQIFFVRLGGWDTHADQLKRHQRLLGVLSEGLLALRAALQAQGVWPQVTVFTASDFGRTLSSNGDGSDHGWGGHALILGGAVRGGKIYGQLPTLALDGPDDAGHGRLIPTTSVTQYAATLARWFGIPAADLPTLFPTLANFDTADLGFMAGA